jgi:hypothetical protein
MDNPLNILYVHNSIVVFSIEGEIYYLKEGADPPTIYTSKLLKMAIPNIDSWLYAKSHQRVSHQVLRDMAVQFVNGMRAAYTKKDLQKAVRSAAVATRKEIFEGPLAASYGKRYFIEVADPVRVETTYARHLRFKFQELLQSMGPDKLYRQLCRLWQYCNYHKPNSAAIFEKLIDRLDRQPSTPDYPDVSDLDNELVKTVQNTVLGVDSPHIMVDQDILAKVAELKKK